MRVQGDILRETGFVCFPEAPWGTHLCLFYESKDDLLEALPLYFAAGLRREEKCIWFLCDLVEEKEARAAMEKTIPETGLYLEQGLLLLLPFEDTFYSGGIFHAGRAVEFLHRQLAAVFERGYEGLRVGGNLCRPGHNGAGAMAAYERVIESYIPYQKMLSLCAYSLPSQRGRETMELLRYHQAIYKTPYGWEPFESSAAKKAWSFQRALAEVLSLLAETDSVDWGIQMVLLKVLEFTGFEAGALRLFTGESFSTVAHSSLSGVYEMLSAPCCYDAEDFFSLGKGQGCLANSGNENKDRDLVFTSFGSLYCRRTGSGEEGATGSLCAGDCVRSNLKRILFVPLKAPRGTIGYFHLYDRREEDILPLCDGLFFLEGISPFVGSALTNLQDRDALIKSESLFRLLADNSRDIIYRARLNPLLQMEYISPAAYRLTGYRPEEFYREAELARKIVGPACSYFSEKKETEARQGDKKPVTMPWPCKDGRTIWLEQYAVPVFDGEGRLLAIEGIARDVTERAEAEEKLKSSHKKLRALSARVLKAQEEERRRLSRELHDNVGQALTTLKIELQILARELAGLAPDFAERVGQSIGVIDATMDFVHLQAVSLRPPVLDDMGLVPAVRHMAESFSKRAGINIQVKTKSWEHKRLGSEVETALFRCVQEALTNIARHAAAKEATVLFDQSNGEISVQISDNGIGFMPEAVLNSEKSLGLIGMQERVELVNGRLKILSRPGGGTTIEIAVPLQKRGPGKA